MDEIHSRYLLADILLYSFTHIDILGAVATGMDDKLHTLIHNDGGYIGMFWTGKWHITVHFE